MILERLKNGESFSNLARQLSIDKGSAKRGGDLGLFGRGMMVRPFEEVAFKLNKRRNDPRTNQDRIWISHNQESGLLHRFIYESRLRQEHCV